MAVATLAAIVERRRTSPSPKRPTSEVLWTLMAPMARSPTMIGTPTYDLAGTPSPRVPSSSNCSSVVRSSGLPDRRIRDVRPSPMVMEGTTAVRPVLEVVDEVDPAGRRVEQGDVGDVGVEGLAGPVADELDERVHVELGRRRLADLVDRRELRRPASGLLHQPGVLEGHAEAGAERGEEAQVVVAEGVLPVEVLERDDTLDLAADGEGREEGRHRRLADDRRRVAVGRCLGREVVDTDRLGRLDDVPAEADERHRVDVEVHPALDAVREADPLGLPVDDRDVDDLGVEDLVDLVADEARTSPGGRGSGRGPPGRR